NLPILVLDPMLATGGSAVAGVRMVKEAGGQAISFLALVAAPEGIAAFHRAHPDVPVYTAAVDQGLNDRAYIVPGLGDPGDRLYGTGPYANPGRTKGWPGVSAACLARSVSKSAWTLMSDRSTPGGWAERMTRCPAMGAVRNTKPMPSSSRTL